MRGPGIPDLIRDCAAQVEGVCDGRFGISCWVGIDVAKDVHGCIQRYQSAISNQQSAISNQHVHGCIRLYHSVSILSTHHLLLTALLTALLTTR